MKKLLVILGMVFSSSLFTYCYGQSPFFIFDSLSSGMTSPGAYVLALALQDSASVPNCPLYAGGHFAIAGRDTAINIAEWIDTNGSYDQGKWFPLGSGVDSDVCALAMYNNYLYAGGKFDTAGGIAASHIARWDTAALKWDSLAGNLNGNVYALCVYNGALYVGGDFTIADGDTVNRIAVWKDSVWAAVGKGFDTGAVYALTVSNDTLYAGGSFLKSNGTAVNHIAKLSGNKWDSVGGGTNNTVYALEDWNQDLYVGGAFTKSGGISTNYISYYDDYRIRQWYSLDTGTNDTVRALGKEYFIPVNIDKIHARVGMTEGPLLVGGLFDSAGGYSAKFLAAWGDSSTGLNGPVFAIVSDNFANNYVGGEFNLATNLPLYFTFTVNNIANSGFFSWGGGVQNITDKSNVKVYPNPSNGVFTMQSSVVSGQLSVEVYNMLGEKVMTEALRSAQGDNTIDLSSRPNGIYLYRVIDEAGNLIGQGKLIIQK